MHKIQTRAFFSFFFFLRCSICINVSRTWCWVTGRLISRRRRAQARLDVIRLSKKRAPIAGSYSVSRTFWNKRGALSRRYEPYFPPTRRHYKTEQAVTIKFLQPPARKKMKRGGRCSHGCNALRERCVMMNADLAAGGRGTERTAPGPASSFRGVGVLLRDWQPLLYCLQRWPLVIGANRTLVVRQLPGRVINIESESLNFADRRSFYFQFFCVIFSACKKCLVFALFLLRHFCGSSNDVKVTLALPRETVHLGTVKFLINGFEKKVRIENWRASEIARCLSRVSDLSRLMAQLSLPTCVYKFHFATFLP